MGHDIPPFHMYLMFIRPPLVGQSALTLAGTCHTADFGVQQIGAAASAENGGAVAGHPNTKRVTVSQGRDLFHITFKYLMEMKYPQL